MLNLRIQKLGPFGWMGNGWTGIMIHHFMSFEETKPIHMVAPMTEEKLQQIRARVIHHRLIHKNSSLRYEEITWLIESLEAILEHIEQSTLEKIKHD